MPPKLTSSEQDELCDSFSVENETILSTCIRVLFGYRLDLRNIWQVLTINKWRWYLIYEYLKRSFPWRYCSRNLLQFWS